MGGMRAGLGLALVAVGGLILLLTAAIGWPLAAALRGVRAGEIDPVLYSHHRFEVFGFALPGWGSWLVVVAGLLAGLGVIGLGLRIRGEDRGA
jgi:hypothetical protein